MWTRILMASLRSDVVLLAPRAAHLPLVARLVSQSVIKSVSGDTSTAATTSQQPEGEVSDQFNEDFDLDEVSEKIFEALNRIDKEQIFVEPGLVKDPLNKPDISEMLTGEETSGRPVNRFRQILYDEGELDGSDFAKPPSPENPHPFNPNILPPTHARSMVVYVNHLPVLQRLIDLGVDLLQVEITTNVGRHLVRMNWERDVKPKIFWLVKEVGVNANDLGDYLTRNPFFLTQTLENLKTRINYLESKNFAKKAIARIVVKNRYWLNNDVKIIDGRLGFIQRQFGLRGAQVREVILKEPRLIAFGVGPIQAVSLLLNKNLGFTRDQMREMLIQDPRLFMCDEKTITPSYHYLTKVMELPLEQIASCPVTLRCSVGDLRRRHEFLYRMKRAQYIPTVPDYVPLESVIHPSDQYFAERVAGVCLENYEKFQKLS